MTGSDKLLGVVVIDDEEDIREVLRMTLSDAGYRVRTAPDGEQGLALCRQSLPQIVVTDIRMPGIDGLQVLEKIKVQWPDVEVIVATAFADMNLAIRALQLDASDFITKPINDEALHLAMRRARQRYHAAKQLRDYTALLEAEKAQKTQELLDTCNLQKNLIESSVAGILACDAENTLVAFNRSMEEMLGFAKAQVIDQKKLDDLFVPGEQLRFKSDFDAGEHGGHGKLYLYETRLLHADGDEVPVQVSATAILEEGRENGLVCFFRDLRKIRALERQMADQARILHQDKMMSLGRLAASMVHEINNPLAGILNYQRLMGLTLKRGPLSQSDQLKFARYLELVEAETLRCSQIVSSLLTFSRKSDSFFSSVEVRNLIDRCVLLSRHKLELSNIEIQVQTQDGLPEIHGDFNQLQQCLINLILNAVDVMPEGGRVIIGTARHHRDQVVEIFVKDTGPGIAQEDFPHLFEPFFTTKKEGYGVGLGLSTVYGIMEAHHGTVEVTSRPGEGACFHLKFPDSAVAGEALI